MVQGGYQAPREDERNYETGVSWSIASLKTADSSSQEGVKEGKGRGRKRVGVGCERRPGRVLYASLGMTIDIGRDHGFEW